MDREFLIDLFADFGPVTIRKMFSGYGISAAGVNFALSLRAGLYFRADEQTIPQFEAEGSGPFQYQTRSKTVTVNSYWQLPARLFDDSEELAVWARSALGAAQRAALRKRPRKRAAARKSKAPAKKTAAKKTAGKKAATKRAAKKAVKTTSRRAPKKKSSS
ncbi:TfoX/Sxy family protein [Bradyrhizobium sp. BEA-2-5]|uniref:TfoX/Sxy family protein n=1 Tax=Bradyrhizobium sp. BEA-2-5 TaxID=3080015 RepID=UPI00293EEFCA|nr:TfoX/Sxy family protein [Bradyrhizobium sp. BEA-2-5]WOH85103.1 TfoX/Sxy family protein [Bradyrhizobium sp. BEA-2-5]